MAISTIGASALDSDVLQLGKNLIQNGAVTLAQRGTSQNLGASPVFTCDRWRWAQSSGTNGTMEQTTTVPSGVGFANSLRFNPSNAQTPGAAEYNIVGQRIEAQNLQHLLYGNAGAKTLTLQFYVRSPKTGTHTFGIFQNDKPGGRNYVGTYTVAVADTWEKITTTIAGDTGGQIDNDNGNGFDIVWNIGSGSNFETATINAWETSASPKYSTSGAAYVTDDAAKDFYITGVQLEVGSVATDFEWEDYGTTLRKCQRYFFAINQISNENQTVGTGHIYQTSRAWIIVDFPVRMRAKPTVSFTGTTTDVQVRHAATASTSSATPSVQIEGDYNIAFLADAASGTPFTVGQACELELKFGSNSSAYRFTAEL